MTIRKLKAEEIEVRLLSIKENGYCVLLYKDARADMRILDETFGIFGWQRKHELINGNLFCTVSILDRETNTWINKQDVGVESFSEKEKGQASDSFKRACTNIGIGRELYTAPFIWIKALDGEIKKSNNKNNVYTKLYVSKIAYDESGNISTLEIKDEKDNIRYSTALKQHQDKKQEKTNSANNTGPKITNAQADEIRTLAEIKRIKVSDLEEKKGKKIEEFTPAEYAKAMSWLKGL
ncbi:MAG: hypothetical protein ACTTIR_09200 [Eggerthia catenaformis]|uniref:hypothetical protein n=1 Tax=Eggerthia catenaformis TaxID=31973 RepID=UPI003F9F103C